MLPDATETGPLSLAGRPKPAPASSAASRAAGSFMDMLQAARTRVSAAPERGVDPIPESRRAERPEPKTRPRDDDRAVAPKERDSADAVADAAPREPSAREPAARDSTPPSADEAAPARTPAPRSGDDTKRADAGDDETPSTDPATAVQPLLVPPPVPEAPPAVVAAGIGADLSDDAVAGDSTEELEATNPASPAPPAQEAVQTPAASAPTSAPGTPTSDTGSADDAPLAATPAPSAASTPDVAETAPAADRDPVPPAAARTHAEATDDGNGLAPLRPLADSDAAAADADPGNRPATARADGASGAVSGKASAGDGNGSGGQQGSGLAGQNAGQNTPATAATLAAVAQAPTQGVRFTVPAAPSATAGRAAAPGIAAGDAAPGSSATPGAPLGAAATPAGTTAAGPASAAGAGRPSPGASASPPAQQIAAQVTRAVRAGSDRISITLDPESLGKVEVKLEVHRDGRVMAMIQTDRQDTLDLLQRDARGLERALQDAGLKADSGSLSFSLRQDGGGQGASFARHGSGGGGSAPGGSGPAVAEPAAPQDSSAVWTMSGRGVVDIRV